MKKLTLDQIQVISFPVGTTKGSGGTVNGFEWTQHASCPECLPDPMTAVNC